MLSVSQRIGILEEDDAPQAFIEKTKALFGTRTVETISDEETRSIIRNMASFFSLLNEWEVASKDSANLAVSETKEI